MINYDELQQAAGESRLLEQEPMSSHISFRVGGPADYLVQASDEKAVADVLSFCRKEQTRNHRDALICTGMLLYFLMNVFISFSDRRCPGSPSGSGRLCPLSYS